MSNIKFFILAIFLIGLLSFSAVSAADNATDEIVCAEEAPVMEQITAEEMGCEGDVATLPELQNGTLTPDSTLKSDENPDGDFIAMENEDSGNLLADGCSTSQSTHDLYGIVDLGSNVMSLSIIKEENGKLEFILSDNRESITATYNEGNVLTQEGIDRLILLLDDFDGIMDSNNVTVKYFFATASLRKLDNCGEVFTAVKNSLGSDLLILNEKEEAQAGFNAVRFVDLTSDDGIVIDIGGGSCEVVAFTDRNPVSMESMPIESRSCYEDYVSSMFPNETEILNIQNRVETELGKLHANNSSPVDDLYGIGGTLFYAKQTLIYLNYIDNETYVIPLSTLDALLAKLLENTTESYRIISDVAPDRINTLSPENLGPTYLALLTVINVTDNIAYGRNVEITVNVTDKLHEPLNGTISVMINGENHTANVENGHGKIILSGLNAGKYDLNVAYSGMNYSAVSPVTFNVLKQNAAISAASKAYVINYGGKYSITLKDVNGKVLTGKNVIFTLNGKSITSATTNAQGVATISVTAKILKAEKAGKKNLVIKFTDSNYNTASKTVKITINKEKTKLVAKNKKFKKAKKVKKYTIVLKNSKGKAIKKVKVTLKVKGKMYTVKTDSKGKATFKIKNLKKKCKFKSTITFKGNAYYNKVTKKVKITVK